jgi:hypothetical protein
MWFFEWTRTFFFFCFVFLFSFISSPDLDANCRSQCGDPTVIPPWVIGISVAAAAVVVIAILLLVFLVRPIRLKLFPFLNRRDQSVHQNGA